MALVIFWCSMIQLKSNQTKSKKTSRQQNWYGNMHHRKKNSLSIFDLPGILCGICFYIIAFCFLSTCRPWFCSVHFAGHVTFLLLYDWWQVSNCRSVTTWLWPQSFHSSEWVRLCFDGNITSFGYQHFSSSMSQLKSLFWVVACRSISLCVLRWIKHSVDFDLSNGKSRKKYLVAECDQQKKKSVATC